MLLKEVNPSIGLGKTSNRFRHNDILAKKCLSRVTTTTMFSRQNDTGSHAHTTCYWENIVLLSSSLFLLTDVTAGEPTKTIDNGPETILLALKNE